ncbi:MAG: hypothetical protein K2H53_03310, partial [Clostridia bacterium]|nr:hypothetical protein [Clostridia bacterium]
VASYMIVLEDYTFKSGETLAFKYNAQIPANLDGNEETYGVFAVYYEEAVENEEENEIAPFALAKTMTQENSPVGLMTEGTLEFEVNLNGKVNDEKPLGSEVEELDEVTFEVTINSSATASNASLLIDLTDNATVVSNNVILVGQVENEGSNSNIDINRFRIPLRKYTKGRDKGRIYCKSWFI